MSFKTTRDVEFDGKKYPTGKAIKFADDRADVRDELLAIGAIAADKTVAPEQKPGLATTKMTKPQLLKLAGEKGVAVAKKEDGTEIPLADATEAQIVLAINSAQPPA